MSKVKESQVIVTNSIEKGTHYVTGSPNRLEQVFVNLIANACDVLSEQSDATLLIEAGSTTLDDVDCWDIRVTDNGPGIDQDHIEHIFTSFFTTKPKGQGTGLGLSISRGIVRDHKGEISVETTRGTGTTFSVLVPKVSAD